MLIQAVQPLYSLPPYAVLLPLDATDVTQFPLPRAYVAPCSEHFDSFLPKLSFYCSRDEVPPPARTWAVLAFSTEHEAVACAKWLRHDKGAHRVDDVKV